MGSSESAEVPQQSGNWSTINCNGTVVNGNFNTVRFSQQCKSKDSPLKKKRRIVLRSSEISTKSMGIFVMSTVTTIK